MADDRSIGAILNIYYRKKLNILSLQMLWNN